MLLIYGSIIILKIKLVIAFKIWIGNGIQSLNFGSLIQSCQIGVLVQSIHSCGTLPNHFDFVLLNILLSNSSLSKRIFPPSHYLEGGVVMFYDA